EVRHGPPHTVGPAHGGPDPDLEVEALHHRLGHRVDQVLLVSHVPVERHRGHPEVKRKAPEADGLQALGVAELQRPRHDRLPREAPPPCPVGSLHRLQSIPRILILAGMSTPYADTNNMTPGSRRAPLVSVLRSRPYLFPGPVRSAST